MAVQSYKDLIVWQKAICLVTDVYRCTETFPRREVYGLSSQLRRAAVSVPSNIAEGQERLSTGEFKQFLGHARGSLRELQTQLVIAGNLGYLQSAEKEKLWDASTEVDRMLSGLLSSLAT
jgi:four helix bundle protein